MVKKGSTIATEPIVVKHQFIDLDELKRRLLQAMREGRCTGVEAFGILMCYMRKDDPRNLLDGFAGEENE